MSNLLKMFKSHYWIKKNVIAMILYKKHNERVQLLSKWDNIDINNFKFNILVSIFQNGPNQSHIV